MSEAPHRQLRLSDVFGLRRRQASRVAILLMVDVQVARTDHFIGFFTQDLSVSGFCLQGQTSDVVERIRTTNRSIPMRVRRPFLHGAVAFEAKLKWEREEEDQILTGWTFTRISREARRAIRVYVEDHPEEVLKDPVR